MANLFTDDSFMWKEFEIMKLDSIVSEDFTLREFLKSQTATRKNIDNTPTEEHLGNAVVLFNMVAQPVRDHFGPTIITSGYRSPELNEAIGGSESSQHMLGQAVDLEVIGVSTIDVARWIDANLEYDQLILEFYTRGQINSGWVHVSYVPGVAGENRNENLTAALESDGRVNYMLGLNA